MAEGGVDIVIGTHALLAKTITFKNLGLVIVDEEQHFGVSHKERLKSLKADVHVLTLTATPIPRTLQLALSGVRDLSLIATAPIDRLAVRTYVTTFDALTIREALLREHYGVYAESVRNLGTPVFPAALFRHVAGALDSDVLTVRHQDKAVASVLSLYFRGTVFPYWGGGTAAARGLRANDRMYFALMSHARDRGCTRFDFGRSKTGTGAAAFKKNWGFTGVPRCYATRSDGPAREVNPLNPKYALMVRAWQRLPLPVANLIGPWISRGLG